IPKRRNVTSSEQKIPAKDDGSVSERPLKLRKQNRPLEDKEICENLTNESDDNCSDFDDDVGDPDFILESDHNTESEQSDEDDVDVTYPHVEEVYHGEINHNHDNEEQEREVRAHGSQDITEQIGKETIVGEKQHGAAETRIEEIGEEQYSEVETRNDQGSEDLRIDQEPNEESTGELPHYFYGKNRYKWASAEPSRTSRVRVHNIVNAPSQEVHEMVEKMFFHLVARATANAFNEITGKCPSDGEWKLAWKRMKLSAKSNLCTYWKERSKTGGGEKPPSPTPEDLQIMAIASHDFVIEVTDYDSDAVDSISGIQVQQKEKLNSLQQTTDEIRKQNDAIHVSMEYLLQNTELKEKV
ncbi:unnamed protein product, partial [Parnassius apollo]